MGAPWVIVGGGSSGCVLSARLTEHDRHEVILLEAGPDYATAKSLPSDLVNGSHNSMHIHDWGYRHLANTGGWNFPLPRGKVVGGSSAVNTCIALRPHPSDLDEWAQMGLTEWSWDKCLPAFKKLERDLDFPSSNDHGHDGPLPIRRHSPEELVPWQAAFIHACRSLGYPACADANAPQSLGVGPLPMNKVNGRRVSAAEAYLTPDVRGRRNLQIRPQTLVRRILFRNHKVCGVEIENPREGITRIDTERVVLAAGAINTPGLLVRSGVGPARAIERLGIELVADIPAVGARLLDHPGVALFLRPRLGSGFRFDAPLIQVALRYTSAGSAHPADMQLQPGSKIPLRRGMLPFVNLMCALNRPYGVGQLTFPSADPRAKPQVHSHFLEDPRDRAQAVEAMGIAFELANTPELRKLAVHLWPSPRVLKDAALRDAWIMGACGSGYHPSGSVPMGGPNDLNAATDSRGRVNRVQGLYVADASLMPIIPSANIHLTVLMVGERLAEWMMTE